MFSQRAALCLGAALIHSFWPFVALPASAAWCWATTPLLQCVAAANGGRLCAEGAMIAEGGNCTPKCEDGKVPCGSNFICPISVDDGSGRCRGDKSDPDKWWTPCGRGQECANFPSLWDVGSGGFTCDTSCGETPMEPATPTQAPKVDLEEGWEVAVWGMVGGTIGVAVLGAFLARLPPNGFAVVLHKKRGDVGSLANVLGAFSVLIVVVVALTNMISGANELTRVFAYGIAAGLTASLPIWWATFKPGVHTLLGMSREAAWRVHAMFGFIALVFGTIHGVHAFVGPQPPIDIFSNIWWTFGLVGLVLMWIGYLPVPMAVFGILHYDKFKLLHFAAIWGYMCCIVHVADHALTLRENRTWIVLIVNLAALAFFILQKVLSMVTGQKAQVEAASVVRDPGGTAHIFLQLKAVGFKFLPGQWAHLQLAPPAAHPFTIVPGPAETVQFFIKVEGPWTRGLAEKIENGELQPNSSIVTLQGPYGSPPRPLDAVVFVLGGVGVTPSLSLVGAAQQLCGSGKMKLYWTCRSPGLLQKAVPLLAAAGLEANDACISLTSNSSMEHTLALPVQRGRQDLREWLVQADAELGIAGVKSALLFVCGPDALIASANAFASGAGTKVSVWQFHAEEFRFLPLKVDKNPASGVRLDGEAIELMGQSQ